MRMLFSFILILFLSSCTSIKPEIKNCLICPPCPIAGPKVAYELEKVCDDNLCPNTIDWLNRYAKTCDILNELN